MGWGRGHDLATPGLDRVKPNLYVFKSKGDVALTNINLETNYFHGLSYLSDPNTFQIFTTMKTAVAVASILLFAGKFYCKLYQQRVYNIMS